MAITSCITNRAKKDFLDGVHQAANEYRCALIKEGATGTYGPGTKKYSDILAEEVVPASNPGYAAGGVKVNRIAIADPAGTAVVSIALDFDDAIWNNGGLGASIKAIGCVVYNYTDPNQGVILVQDFNGTISSTNSEFKVKIDNALTLGGGT